MGKNRDLEITQHGGKPVNEEALTDREILQLARDTYWNRGEMPPDIRRILEEIKQKGNQEKEN